MSILTKHPELLCPAGDLERLIAAVDYGADAVYLAGREFGMRTACDNFGQEELERGVAYAHERQRAVYVACNTLPRNEEMARLPAFLEQVTAVGADGILVADPGTLRLVRRYAPDIKVHVSVQAGICNYEAARAFYDWGASRVVLARELSLEEIAEIRAKTPADLQLECFVHGAMCVSYSARCLLSSYMTGRDANRGDCAQPCRWKYALVEETRPGEYRTIEETDQGSYILNAEDLCMAPYLDRLMEAGADSFKIEGRAKSQYYVAAVTGAYRGAVDSLLAACAAGTPWELPGWVAEELDKISHRPYGTGFYFGQPRQSVQNGGYCRDYAVAGVVESYENGMLTVIMKNKFYGHTTFDCIQPGRRPFLLTAGQLYDETGTPIDHAPHPMMKVRFACDTAVAPGAMLRIRT